ncbi:MAG: lactoylglutathione lyase [Alphaproteobacteria bacterium]|nr:lactoylglutathione lyase [Alphaproteobacteria bacterium]
MSVIQGRLLHTMLHVGNLERSIDFYTRMLGMRVLRSGVFPEEGRSNAFIGYGEESDTTVLELTQWRGVSSYEHGKAFGHLAIAAPDLVSACAALRSAGVKVTREPWTVPSGTVMVAFIEDPDGYAIELVQRLS